MEFYRSKVSNNKEQQETRWESLYRIVRPERRTKLWEGLQEEKPVNELQGLIEAMELMRSEQSKCGSTPEQDETMM